MTTTRERQVQYLVPIEGNWFLPDAKIAVLGFKLVKDDLRHQHHDMRERAKARARRGYGADVVRLHELRPLGGISAQSAE